MPLTPNAMMSLRNPFLLLLLLSLPVAAGGQADPVSGGNIGGWTGTVSGEHPGGRPAAADTLHAGASASTRHEESGVTLSVETGEFRRIRGDLYIEVSDADGETLAAEIHPVTARTMNVQVDSLPPGTRAVRLFHDENSNGKLDTNLFGIPTEGYGFSNNPRSRFGEPDFEDRLFEHRSDSTIRVRLTYW